MTNKEAINYIVAYAFFTYEDIPEEVAKALDMAIEALKDERAKGRCKHCKSYRQYGSRADGYCDIARMTTEGMSHINVSEDFYCSYFEEADNETNN